jgi:endo-1,4-beta-xylanase
MAKDAGATLILDLRPYRRKAVWIALAACWSVGPSHAEMPEYETEASREILSGADERIETHRKGDSVIVLKDASGEALANVQVRLEQLNHEFLFGTHLLFALDVNDASQNQIEYRERLKALMNYAVLPFHWSIFEKTKGTTEDDEVEQMARWCRQNGIKTKGFPLVWHEALPYWLWNERMAKESAESQDALLKSPSEVEALLQERVRHILTRFKGQVDHWGLVNEITIPNKQLNPVSGWIQDQGYEQSVSKAFSWAMATDPEGFYLINDWNYFDKEYENLIDSLVEQNAGVSAIGLQSHMVIEKEWRLDFLWDICQKYASRELPLHFTEATVLSSERYLGQNEKDLLSEREGWVSTKTGEVKQAEYLEKFYTLLFSHPSVEAIVYLGLSDKRSWLGAPYGLLREDMSPKPSYDRLHALIKGKWNTDLDVKSDAEGEVRFRGFYGAYRLSAKHRGKDIHRDFEILKGRSNRIVITVE